MDVRSAGVNARRPDGANVQMTAQASKIGCLNSVIPATAVYIDAEHCIGIDVDGWDCCCMSINVDPIRSRAADDVKREILLQSRRSL